MLSFETPSQSALKQIAKPCRPSSRAASVQANEAGRLASQRGGGHAAASTLLMTRPMRDSNMPSESAVKQPASVSPAASPPAPGAPAAMPPDVLTLVEVVEHLDPPELHELGPALLHEHRGAGRRSIRFAKPHSRNRIQKLAWPLPFSIRVIHHPAVSSTAITEEKAWF